MAKGAVAEADLEEAANAFADDEDDEDTTEDEPVEGETGTDAYGRLERRLRKAYTNRLATYEAKAAERHQKWVDAQEARIQNRLDEFALNAGSTSKVTDPEAIRQSIERQVAAHQAKMEALQQQLAKLAS